jgi:hypothetical protein
MHRVEAIDFILRERAHEYIACGAMMSEIFVQTISYVYIFFYNRGCQRGIRVYRVF